MSHKRKGQLATCPEYCKHLRKELRKCFWKKERLAEKKYIRKIVEESKSKY